ncbi:uncharacterized protein LOC122260733 [Penaeus japonicus]|uniref:uncharacterized protein LOC122260733 n=1 Tax=Penaeus japonicus TaxID=27405 RepID=UPI001C7106DE|nr:uncharacterized protein LOC122260733 [Penaeus japonicus]
MFRIALWASAFLLVSGISVDSSDLVGELTVFQLRELMAEVLSEGLPLHNNCTDYSQTTECNLVVENKLCNKEEFYARFCCRSCTLAGQIPTFGPHLRLTAEAPLTARITTEAQVYPHGSDFNLSCVASGFPAPEIFWFRENSPARINELYEEHVEATTESYPKIVRSDLLITNYTRREKFICLAINIVGSNKSYMTIDTEDEATLEFFPKSPVFEAKSNITLECIGKGRGISNISWVYGFQLASDSETISIEESISTENGVTTVHSKISILRNKIRYNKNAFSCFMADGRGKYMEREKTIIISEAEVPPQCSDVIDSKACYEDRSRCGNGVWDIHVSRYCCRTCALANSQRSYFPKSVAILPERPMLEATDEVTLECVSIESGIHNLTWLIDDGRVEDFEKYRIEESTSTQNGTKRIHSKLSILRDKTSDNGKMFHCLGASDNGTVTTRRVLYFAAPLIVDMYYDIRAHSYGAKMELRCRSWGFPGLQEMTWHKGDRKIGNSSHYHIKEMQQCTPLSCKVETTLTILGIEGSDVGRYTCRVANILMKKEIIKILTFSQNGKAYLRDS